MPPVNFNENNYTWPVDFPDDELMVTAVSIVFPPQIAQIPDRIEIMEVVF